MDHLVTVISQKYAHHINGLRFYTKSGGCAKAKASPLSEGQCGPEDREDIARPRGRSFLPASRSFPKRVTGENERPSQTPCGPDAWPPNRTRAAGQDGPRVTSCKTVSPRDGPRVDCEHVCAYALSPRAGRPLPLLADTMTARAAAPLLHTAPPLQTGRRRQRLPGRGGSALRHRLIGFQGPLPGRGALGADISGACPV